MENFRRTFNLGSPGSNLDHQNPASSGGGGGGGTRPRLYPSLSQVEESRNYNLYNRSTSNEDADSANKNPSEMKQKILSVWHGIKYGKTAFSWNSEALMSSSVLQEDSKAKMKADSCGLGKYSAVWLLGRMYHSKGGPSRSFDDDGSGIEAFKSDFHTRLWFTYRKDFETFNGSSLNSDCGWGCMIRSGQMMLGAALVQGKLGRDWRWNKDSLTDRPSSTSSKIKELKDENLHRDIVRLFGDSNQPDTSPLSIHRLVSIAEECLDKRPGDWFGPSSTAHLLKDAVNDLSPSSSAISNPLLGELCVYVAQDCTVYTGDVLATASKRAEALRGRRRRVSSRISGSFAACSVDSGTSPNANGFSLVDYPTEYRGIESAMSSSTNARLYGGVVEGVPVFDDSDVVRVTENDLELDDFEDEDELNNSKDFQLLSDGTENFALNQQVSIYGDHWIMEGPDNDSKPRDQRGNLNKKKKPSPKPASNLEAEDLWVPTVIMVPLRLGADKFNPVYSNGLRTLFTTENCLGLIGGRPKHSLYFIGFQDDSLIHLDPHLAQDTVNVRPKSFPLETFHCGMPRKMNLSKMDPSCCIGFYCHTREDFDSWVKSTRELLISTSVHPLFEISDGSAEDCLKKMESSTFDMEESMARSTLDSSLGGGGGGASALQGVSEEFVFI